MKILKKISIIIAVIFFIAFLWYGYLVASRGPVARADLRTLVRQTPKWFGFFDSIFSTEIAQAIYPHIYLPKAQYEEFTSGDYSVWLKSVLVHEMTHLVRQEKMHPLVLGIKYSFYKKFRLQEELTAIKEQMEFLKENGAEYRIEWKAKQFAGREYGNMISEDRAMEILTHLWQTGEVKID